ncbi:26342_t:CDS:2 [Dentiscutata erythropus]|uniref:26342_t:CDS:1 n=1 Tax=Dentiscutata erythropus TaxID=1348616 RepID=A0A9N9HLI1_9GLOM|nr:26342_t:CDS:2 [Dentiscutata erythropus]
MKVNKKTFLQEIITSSKSKKELIKKLSREDPEYLIENLKNIEYVANIIYETPKNVNNKESESENDNNEELLKKKTKKSPTPYNNFVKKEYPKLKDDYEHDQILRVIGTRWKTSPKNPKNNS